MSLFTFGVANKIWGIIGFWVGVVPLDKPEAEIFESNYLIHSIFHPGEENNEGFQLGRSIFTFSHCDFLIIGYPEGKPNNEEIETGKV